MTSARITVRHEPERSRFVAQINDPIAEAVVEYRSLQGRTLEYYRTFTPVELRGQGIAGQLVAEALDYALENGYRVEPTCPFVAQVIKKNPKYADVLAV